jgi:hypothetical protein
MSLMRSAAFLRRVSLLAAAALMAVSLTGCNAVILLGYLIGGPPSIEPDFHKATGKSLEGKNTRVLVMAYAPTELRYDNDAVDYELAKHVAHRLNLQNIRVVDPDRVHSWLDKNRDWNNAAEVGAEFKVDYVIHIDLTDYSLFEEHSSDLYRGRAEALVTVWKMDEDKKGGESIYSKQIVSRFPKGAPVSVYSQSYANFKKLYLSTLSNEIGVLFYESFAGDDIPNTALN